MVARKGHPRTNQKKSLQRLQKIKERQGIIRKRSRPRVNLQYKAEARKVAMETGTNIAVGAK